MLLDRLSLQRLVCRLTPILQTPPEEGASRIVVAIQNFQVAQRVQRVRIVRLLVQHLCQRAPGLLRTPTEMVSVKYCVL